MRILLSGATGLIGRTLWRTWQNRGHTVVPLVRRPPPGEESFLLWEPQEGLLDISGLEGFDVVVHLAGENIAARRWTKAQKERIRSSRVDGTRLLCRALASLERKPSVLLSASAVGIYGDRGDEILTEASPSGQGFLAEVCRDWEAATLPAQQVGIRVTHLRFGAVLSPEGGLLAKTASLFRWALGGRLGSGRQWISWVSLDDVTAAIQYLLVRQSMSGPVNITSPSPVTNADWTRLLGRALRRPTLFRVPAFMLRFLVGEMAKELLLASTRAVPRRLEENGFEFRDSLLEPTLRRMLG